MAQASWYRRTFMQRQAPWMDEPNLALHLLRSLVLTLIFVMMVFPFLNIVAVSFSSYKDVLGGGLILFPANPTLDAYRVIFEDGSVIRALQVSFFLTIVGTAAQMVATVMLAYGLSRPGVPGSRFFLIAVLATMLFAPGMIPMYLLIKELGLLDSYAALIMPKLVSAFNFIILRQFFMNLPSELIESARLDGASDFRLLWDIMLPLSKAVLAVIALFYAVGMWNSFFDAILYINDPTKWPIQVVLQQTVLQGTSLNMASVLDPNAPPPPPKTVEMAIVVAATFPIIVVYPFIQKYFTRGVLTGAIKG
jgi:ABC-type glycerol-3-phosphate transport system permease component